MLPQSVMVSVVAAPGEGDKDSCLLGSRVAVYAPFSILKRMYSNRWQLPRGLTS